MLFWWINLIGLMRFNNISFSLSLQWWSAYRTTMRRNWQILFHHYDVHTKSFSHRHTSLGCLFWILEKNHLLASFVFLDRSKRGWQDLLNVFFIIVNRALAYRHRFGSSSVTQSQRHRCRHQHLLPLLREQHQVPTLILHAISCNSFPYLTELVVFRRCWSDR